MNQLIKSSKIKTVVPEELSKQLDALGISAEELAEQFVSLDLSLDEVIKKMASVGIPSVLLVTIIANFGTVPLVTTLATSLTGTMGVIGDSLVGFGIEMTVVNFYLERLKTEPLEELIEELNLLPLTDTLKNKVKDRLTNQVLPRIEKKITIVYD